MNKWLIIEEDPNNFESPQHVFSFTKKEERDTKFDIFVKEMEAKTYEQKTKYFKAQITEWVEAELICTTKVHVTKVDY